MSFFLKKYTQNNNDKNQIIHFPLFNSIKSDSVSGHILINDDKHLFVLYEEKRCYHYALKRFNFEQQIWDSIAIKKGINQQLQAIFSVGRGNQTSPRHIKSKICMPNDTNFIIYIIDLNATYDLLIKLGIDFSTKRLLYISCTDIDIDQLLFINIHLSKKNILYGMAVVSHSWNNNNTMFKFLKFNDKFNKFITYNGNKQFISKDNQLLKLVSRPNSMISSLYNTSFFCDNNYLYVLLWYDLHSMQVIKLNINDDDDDIISSYIQKIAPIYEQKDLLQLTDKSGKTAFDYTIYPKVCFAISDSQIVFFDMESSLIHFYNLKTKEMINKNNNKPSTLLQHFNQKGKSHASKSYKVTVLRDSKQEKILIAGFIRQQQQHIPTVIASIIALYYIHQMIQLIIVTDKTSDPDYLQCWLFNVDLLFE